MEKKLHKTLRNRGTDTLKEKHYREALGFYMQGMDAKPDVQLKEALLLNRVACNLELLASHPKSVDLSQNQIIMD